MWPLHKSDANRVEISPYLIKIKSIPIYSRNKSQAENTFGLVWNKQIFFENVTISAGVATCCTRSGTTAKHDRSGMSNYSQQHRTRIKIKPYKNTRQARHENNEKIPNKEFSIRHQKPF